jgi:hypothetical protein
MEFFWGMITPDFAVFFLVFFLFLALFGAGSWPTWVGQVIFVTTWEVALHMLNSTEVPSAGGWYGVSESAFSPPASNPVRRAQYGGDFHGSSRHAIFPFRIKIQISPMDSNVVKQFASS